MREWDAERVAAAARARQVAGGSPAGGPARVMIDSRLVEPGDLFIGLPGTRTDGGMHAAGALAAGAWGVLVGDVQARALRGGEGAVLSHPDPLAGLAHLARAWRRHLRARVVAVTGSTGKTSTKDILAALLSGQLRTVASPQNMNTEIGLPLAILSAPAGTQVLVLEMGMRGPGQIAELTAIAEPDVGVIVSLGPVHLELLGSMPAIAAAKAELIDGLEPGATLVIPAGESLLSGHLRADLQTVSFGRGGDVTLSEVGPEGWVVISDRAGQMQLRPSFDQAHQLSNLLAAVAVTRALGVTPAGELDVVFSGGRGERIALADSITLVDDCYNANPMSMRAALDDLARTASGRRVAVLGDMLELGRGELDFHRELGAYAQASGVEVLVTVGPLAAAMRACFEGEAHAVTDALGAAALLSDLLREGDTVLVKGSFGVGLRRVSDALVAARPVASTERGARDASPVGGAR